MKKIISILAILVLIFSLSACKRAPKTEDEEVILDKEEEVPETEDPKTEEAEQGENNQTDEPEVQEPTEDITDDTTEESLQTEQQAHDPALDRVFSPYEVIVVLTEEETAKKLTYTPAGFPEVDSYYVQDVTGYFNGTNPEYNDLTALTILLNEATKQNVLDSIKILEQDERIHAAHTNSAPISNWIDIDLKDKTISDYTIKDFPSIDIQKIHCFDDSRISQHAAFELIDVDGKMTDYARYEKIYNSLKEMLNDSRFELLYIYYYDRGRNNYLYEETVYIELKDEYIDEIDKFTTEDFTSVQLSEVVTVTQAFTPYGRITALSATFAKPSFENLYEYIALLEQDEKVYRVYTRSSGIIVYD